MSKYTGECFGGPKDGESFSRPYPIIQMERCRIIGKPKVMECDIPDKFVETEVYGEYHYVDGKWIWKEKQ